ncbi:MAG: type II toxin-antitoxin system VapC family toxin [Candidatus Electrothrix sp. AR3]|nr:type II toxin-antitoxin system VapC family toxin [Candidatus Electrothrix sp. AR3]
MYLLDTDTIIYNLKGHPTVQENLRQHYKDPLCLSVISLMELYYGVYKSEKVESNLAKVKTIESSLTLIRAGEEVVELFGMLKSQQEAKGQRVDDFDLVIASTALSHNLILVTNNTRHFQRIEGLKLENWSKAE